MHISDEQYASLVENDGERMIDNIGSMDIQEWLDSMPLDQSVFWQTQMFRIAEEYGIGSCNFRTVENFLQTWLHDRGCH